MTTKVVMNGVILEPADAHVSVFDRGFLYGDSIYEVLRTYGGRPFARDAHLQRLAHSAERIGMSLPVPLEVLAAETELALRTAGNPESYVRIIVTRGAGEIGLDPGLAEDPLRIVIVRTLATPDAGLYERGAKVALVLPMRTPTEPTPDGSPKTGNYLPNVLAVAEAKRRGAYEALLIDRDGRVLEGASSNVFVVRQGALATPPLSEGILEGITRRHVLAIARDLGFPTHETPLGPVELRAAEEVFITSTIREVVPIVDVDGAKIGDGHPGPVTRRIMSAFHQRAAAEAKA